MIGSLFDKLNDPFATPGSAFVLGGIAARPFRRSTIGGTVAVFSMAPLVASVTAIVALSWPGLSRPARMARRTPPSLATH